MSRDAEDWVWEHSTSKGTGRLVALAIAVYASGPECTAYAGLTMLMHRTGAGRSAVRTSIDALIECGELAIVPDAFGPRYETTYSLPRAIGYTRAGGSDSDPGQILTRVGKNPRGGTDSDPGGAGFVPQGGTDSDPLSKSSRSSKRRERSAQPAGRRVKTGPSASGNRSLSEVPEDWQPNASALAAAAADVSRLGPVAVEAATRKFIAYNRSRDVRMADPGPAWVSWLSRERVDPRNQPTPTAPSYAEQIANLAARMAAEEAVEAPALRSLAGGIDPAAAATDSQRALLLAVVNGGSSTSASEDVSEIERDELRAAGAADLTRVLQAIDELGETTAIALYGGRLVAGALHLRTTRTGT